MATLLHALAALVFGNFRFASFFERAHSVFQIREPGFNHLIRHVAITSLIRRLPDNFPLARWSEWRASELPRRWNAQAGGYWLHGSVRPQSRVVDPLQKIRESVRTADMWAVSAGQLNRLDSEQLSGGLPLPRWRDRPVIRTDDISGR
jgi:hypothetical protein